MPLLTQEKAIKEYYETIKDKYPHLSFDDVQGICKTPGAFIKECIRGNHYPTVLVKYIGKFRVFGSKLKAQIKNEKAYLERGIITQEVHDERVDRYQKHLKALEDEKDNDDCEGEETTD
jgi:hypothetical protein